MSTIDVRTHLCPHSDMRTGLAFDLNINRDHLIINDYLPAKFEAPGAERA